MTKADYTILSKTALSVLLNLNPNQPITLATATKIVGAAHADDALTQLDERGFVDGEKLTTKGVRWRNFELKKLNLIEEEDMSNGNEPAQTEPTEGKTNNWASTKIAEVKAATGREVSEKAVKWSTKTGGYDRLNDEEKIAAMVAADEYAKKNQAKFRELAIGAYVNMRQAIEAKKAADYRKSRAAGAPS